jgi:hypothetical protein
MVALLFRDGTLGAEDGNEEIQNMHANPDNQGDCRHCGFLAAVDDKEVTEDTADEDGEMVYTAEFKNEAFTIQKETVAIPKKGALYYFLKGNGQTWKSGSDKTADFTVKRSENDETTISHFTGIQVDGKKVAEKYYTKESGSVIINIKPDYMNELKNGGHKITAEFDDGSVTGSFDVAEKDSGDPGKDSGKSSGKKNSNSSGKSSSKNSGKNSGKTSGNNANHGKGTRTGDSTNILLVLIIMLSAALVMVTSVTRRRKR